MSALAPCRNDIAVQVQLSEIDSVPEHEIYWNSAKYQATAEKSQFIYHRCAIPFIGKHLIPLNQMPVTEGFNETYKEAISKYQGREDQMKRVITPLNCFWNDVIFLSPIHPHKIYEMFKEIGYAHRHAEFFKIPADLLNKKRVAVWKWLDYPIFPSSHPKHDDPVSYCSFEGYQEMKELREDTKNWHSKHFDPQHISAPPKLTYYRVPHVLCQDPIDISNPGITVVNWEDPMV